MDIPESLHVDYQNDSPISIESIYPNWKSLCKLFFIFLLYNIIGAIAFGIFIADVKNLATPPSKIVFNFGALCCYHAAYHKVRD